MEYTIEVDKEEDGRWIAEVMEIPGVMVYGKTKHHAIMKAKLLALRVITDQADEDDEELSIADNFSFAYA